MAGGGADDDEAGAARCATLDDPAEEEAAAAARASSIDVGPTLPASPGAALAGARALAPGTRVGRFVLLEPAGAGATAVVWAAYDPTLDRRVALKLVGGGADAEGLRARLLREAQALGRVSHPHIVPIFEVGTHGDAVFIAEEFVAGTDLARWLAARRRDWRVVLDVFRQAGEGLAAAHRAGIVHRDFKPGNVLLGDDGRVRVVDLGLARALADATPDPGPPVPPVARPESASGSAPGRAALLSDRMTEVGALVGTPLYMSPEQHLGMTADARSDQFSFAVALYEGLHGRPPFTGATLEELRRAVLAAEVPAATGDVPARIERALRKALARDPAARWPSMGALLSQLTRGASPRRWWIAVAALLLAAAALATALVTALRPRAAAAPPCRGGAALVATAWGPGQRASVEAAFRTVPAPYAADAWRATAALLDDYAASWEAMHREACEASLRREQSPAALDRRMLCLEARLAELRALAGLLARADAGTVERAVDAAAGLRPVAACADLAALMAPVAPPADPAGRAAVASARARVARARVLDLAGDHAGALVAAADAVAAARATAYRPVEGEALYVLGHMQSDEPARAEATLEEALWAAIEGGDRRLEAEAATMLVTVTGRWEARLAQGRFWARHAGAALAASPAVELEEALGMAVGELEFAAGDYAAALARHERVLALVERRQGAASDVAASLTSVGNALWALGRQGEALAAYRRALGLEEEFYGPRHPRVATTLNNLGTSLYSQGDLDGALAHLRRALAIREEALGPRHPEVAGTLGNIGSALAARGDLDGALEHHLRALSLREAALGPRHPEVAVALNNLGNIAYGRGDRDGAAAYYRRALEIFEAVLGSEHPHTATGLFNVAIVRRDLGASAEALTLFRRALAIQERALGAAHVDTCDSLANVAELEGARGRCDLAEPLARRAQAIDACGPDAGAIARFALARCLLARDRAAALALAEEAAALLGDDEDAAPTRAAIRAWLARAR